MNHIKSAVMIIGGITYEADSHGRAMELAILDNKDLSGVDRWRDGLFKTTDGRIINRYQAKDEFGIDSSELIPTQFGMPRRQHYPTPNQN